MRASERPFGVRPSRTRQPSRESRSKVTGSPAGGRQPSLSRMPGPSTPRAVGTAGKPVRDNEASETAPELRGKGCTQQADPRATRVLRMTVSKPRLQTRVRTGLFPTGAGQEVEGLAGRKSHSVNRSQVLLPPVAESRFHSGLWGRLFSSEGSFLVRGICSLREFKS